jgi:hypothetical protein
MEITSANRYALKRHRPPAYALQAPLYVLRRRAGRPAGGVNEWTGGCTDYAPGAVRVRWTSRRLAALTIQQMKPGADELV